MTSPADSKFKDQALVLATGLLAGLLFIALGMMLFGDDSKIREIVFGNDLRWLNSEGEVELRIPEPFTVQNVMWLMWFIGWAVIALRVLQTNRDMEPVNARLLPEDPETMLRAKDLGPIYQRVNEGGYSEDAFLPRLINRTILQFQSSRSVSQASSILNSTLELCHHEVELRYNGLRFLVWFIPTLGFIGTVLGIAVALNTAATVKFNDNEAMQAMMPTMTSDLGVAFYTTLVALVQSAFLVFALHLTQAREERTLNRAGQYCLDNLINRLWDK